MTASLAIGCMNFGKRTDVAESERVIARAVDAGLTVFDTANVYNDGESERVTGRALRGRRGVTIATKVGLARVGGKPEGLSRAAITSAIDGSLARLAVDCVDIYYLHKPDPDTPVEETLDALAGLLRAGKIRAWGVSNYASWQILEIFALCDARGLARPVISQVIYNVMIRQLEIEYLRFARKYQLHTTIYNPLAGGMLAGHHKLELAHVPAASRFGQNKLYRSRYWTERIFAFVGELRAIAEGEGMALLDLAYAWVAGRPGIDSILVGPASVAHLDAAIAGCAHTLSPDALQRIDGVWRDFTGTDACYAR